MKRNAWLPLLWAVALLWSASSARADEPAMYLVIAVSPEDLVAAERLRELVDQPIAIVSAELAREPTEARELARERGYRIAAVIDGAQRRVFVVRGDDPTVLTRSLAEGAGTDYGEAFVAAELLSIADQLQRPAAPEPPSLRLPLGFGVGVDMLASAPFRGRPRLGLLATVGFPPGPRPWAWELTLAAGVRGRAESQSQLGTVRIQRTDLTLRLGPRYERHRLSLLVAAALGMSRVRAELDRARLARDVSLLSGLLLGARVRTFGPVHVYLNGLASFPYPRREYRVLGVPIADDPVLLLQVELGLSVFLHSR